MLAPLADRKKAEESEKALKTKFREQWNAKNPAEPQEPELSGE